MVTFKMFKICAIQMCSSKDMAENLAEAGYLASLAAKNGAELIVFPEMFSCMGTDAVDVSNKILSIFRTEYVYNFLAGLAKKHNFWVIGGTIPFFIDGFATKFKSRCCVFDNNGELVTCYDKIHLFDVAFKKGVNEYNESKCTIAGDKLVVVDTPFGTIGLAVCYDLRFPDLFVNLVEKGAEIIVIPAAFTKVSGKMHWEVLLRARAIENLCYVVAANQVGENYPGRFTYGHSMIIDPLGRILKKMTSKRGIICHTMNLRRVREIRSVLPFIEHRYIFKYS